MPNDAVRAEFWKEFICAKCQFPTPQKLRAQFAAAVLSEFCNCGCNSFRVTVQGNAEPLLRTGHAGVMFEADFSLNREKTLEILLFADRAGNLSYVEIDCCANAYPVPEVIDIREPPYHVFMAEQLRGDQ